MQSKKIEELELSARSYNFLKKAGISELGQLVSITNASELFCLAKTSPRNLSDIEEAVKKEGYIWHLIF